MVKTMMNRHFVRLAVFPLLTALCAFGTTRAHGTHSRKTLRPIPGQNQFHFAPTKGWGLEMMSRRSAGEHRQLPAAGFVAKPARGQRVTAPPHRNIQPPGSASAIGFVSATQVPAGGYLTRETLMGDFNGDGNPDFVSIVGDPNNTGNFSFAVVMSNGDGTFQTPVLTAVPGNTTDPFAVADVNNDGCTDVILVHQANAVDPASFYVMLSNGDGTFTVGNGGNPYVITANSLSGGTVADFDHDGKLDVVVVDGANPASVWVVTGNNDGTFNPVSAPISLGGPAGFDVFFADLNGDGQLDVTGNDLNTGEQTVYLATSASQFAPAALYPTSDGVYDACNTTIGDLTGDGKPEIISPNCQDNTITIFVNNGDGTFQTGQYYNSAANPTTGNAIYSNPESVAIGDVNGDGVPDLVTTNNYTGDVTVLTGNGDGTVNVPTNGYAVGGAPVRPAIIADLNGDGLADVIVPDDYYSLVYMKGYGDGTFQAAVNYYSPIGDTGKGDGVDIATGDFNGDGLADVVLGNSTDPTVGISVFLSNADGTLQPGVNYGTGGGLEYVAVGDFDKDGILDIAAADYNNGVVQIFKGNGANGVGDGTFTSGATYPTDTTVTGPSAVVVADFNQDGFPDLAVANSAGSNVGVLLNDGHGAFGAPMNYATCASSPQVTAADLNGDGYPDLVIPMPACTGVGIFLNLADGTGMLSAMPDLGVGNRPYQIAVGDMNGDAKADLVITMDDYLNGHGISVALGNNDGTFQAPNTPGYAVSTQPAYYQPLPQYVKLVDLDGDGNLDAIYNNANYGTVGVLRGMGDGTLSAPVAEYPAGSYAFGLAVGDVNGDGAPDVVASIAYTSGVTTLINSSGSGVTPDYSLAANPNTQTVTAGQTATYTITLTGRYFYNGTVTFACDPASLPSKTSCTFTPATLTPNGNGAITTTLSLKTTATVTTSEVVQGHATTLLASLTGMGLFGLILAGDWKKKGNRRLGMVLMVIAVGMLITMAGCGGSSSTPTTHQTIPGTPSGSYPNVHVTATGTAGTTHGNTSQHTLTLTLNVN